MGGLSVRHEVLSLALRDPFRIARSDHARRGHTRSRPSSSRSGIRTTRTSSGWGRATRTGSTARRRRRWPPSSRSCSTRIERTSFEPTRRVAAWRRGPDAGCDPRPRGRQVRPRHRPARPRRQGPRRARSIACWTCRSTTCRRPTSPSASTSRPSSPSGPAGRPTSRRSRSSAVARRTSPRSRPSGRSSTDRSGSMPTPAGPARPRRRCCRRWSTSGVELIEQPFPATRLPRPRLAPGALRPCRSWPTSRAVFEEDLDALEGVVAGVNVKLAKVGGIGPARSMLEAAPRARASGPSSGAWRRPRSGSPRRRSSRSLADWVDLDGNLLLADDPFSGLELGPDKRWRPGRGPGPGPDAAGGLTGSDPPARTARTFGERPFVWTSSWMKSWTSPLPVEARSGLRWRPTASTSPGSDAQSPTSTGRAGTMEVRRSDSRGPDRLDRALFAMHAERARDPVRGRARPAGREGAPSMDPRTAATRRPDQDAVEFIRFCYRPPTRGLAGAL